MRRISAVILTVALAVGTQAAIAQSSMVAGLVIKVDQSAKKITIKHGPIPKFDMDEGMTMVYAAPDPTMLNAVKAGDKVNFEAEQVNGQFTLTKIEKVK
jgi:Cu(I)/Ag(I) efflux system protein CusF